VISINPNHYSIKKGVKMRNRAVCLSVSKRNKRYLDLIDDYSLEFNLNKAQTIFRIIGEYNTYRCLDAVRK
jgi:hypothetical protein